MAGKMAGKWARRGRLVVAGLLLGAVLAGCAGQVEPATSGRGGMLSPKVPTGTAVESLSPSQLYDLAVSQYRQLFEIIKQVNAQGGTPQLPSSVNAYLINPAWGAFNDVYSGMFLNGYRYDGVPDYQITAIAPLTGEKLAAGTIVAIQTCEMIQGAPFIDKMGVVLDEGNPVTQHVKTYLKFDDNQLKVFVSNNKVVDTCPID